VVKTVMARTYIWAVAVQQQRRPTLIQADEFLARLTPARMRHLGVDVGQEPVFGRLQGLPETLRPLIREGEAHDRFDRLETVFPRYREPQWSAVLLGHRLPVSP